MSTCTHLTTTHSASSNAPGLTRVWWTTRPPRPGIYSLGTLPVRSLSLLGLEDGVRRNICPTSITGQSWQMCPVMKSFPQGQDWSTSAAPPSDLQLGSRQFQGSLASDSRPTPLCREPLHELFMHYHIQQSHLSQHWARLQPAVCGIMQPPGVGEGPVSQPRMFSNEALAWVERLRVATWASPDSSCI